MTDLVRMSSRPNQTLMTNKIEIWPYLDRERSGFLSEISSHGAPWLHSCPADHLGLSSLTMSSLPPRRQPQLKLLKGRRGARWDLTLHYSPDFGQYKWEALLEGCGQYKVTVIVHCHKSLLILIWPWVLLDHKISGKTNRSPLCWVACKPVAPVCAYLTLATWMTREQRLLVQQ